MQRGRFFRRKITAGSTLVNIQGYLAELEKWVSTKDAEGLAAMKKLGARQGRKVQEGAEL